MFETIAQIAATATAKIPGAVSIAEEVVTSTADAKTIWQSVTFKGATAMAVAWTAHNISSWLVLSEPTVTMVVWSVVGALSYATVVVGVLRRNDIKVPNWIAAAAELVATATK